MKYKAEKGFIDLTEKPKQITKTKHKQLQKLQMELIRNAKLLKMTYGQDATDEFKKKYKNQRVLLQEWFVNLQAELISCGYRF